MLIGSHIVEVASMKAFEVLVIVEWPALLTVAVHMPSPAIMLGVKALISRFESTISAKAIPTLTFFLSLVSSSLSVLFGFSFSCWIRSLASWLSFVSCSVGGS